MSTRRSKAPTRKTDDKAVTVVVESKGGNRYNIATADLEAIAAQLRGKKSFSVFYSIIIPIGVTVLTAFLTTVIGQWFQYVSWRNTAILQEATDRTARGIGAYTKASRAISNRYYATFLFADVVEDLMNRKTAVDSQLFALDLDLNKQRFKSYYDQLKFWNENYDEMLGEVDFALDRPVGIRETVRRESLRSINCADRLIPQLAKDHADKKYSLKLQFAAINNCFAQVTTTAAGSGTQSLNTVKDLGVVDSSQRFDSEIGKHVVTRNNHVLSMANEFRCFALIRIEYLKSQQTNSIQLSQRIQKIASALGMTELEDNLAAHYREMDSRCAL